MLSSVAAALAGMLYAGRLHSGRFQFGEGDELSVIAAAVLGGTSLFGGAGTVVGSIMGALMIGLINNGLVLMGLEFSQQLIARGAIIIIAVAISQTRKRVSSKRTAPVKRNSRHPMPNTFFNPHQRATIEAAMARIIPTDDTPGAREAGCIDFLDRYLSGIGYIFAKPDGSGLRDAARAAARRLDAAHRDHARPLLEGIRDLDARAQAPFCADFVGSAARRSRMTSCTL